MTQPKAPVTPGFLTEGDQLIQSLKSFSNRWGRMSALLLKSLKEKNTPGDIKALQTRLAKLHLDAIGKLLPLLGQGERSALVEEIIAVDGKLLEEFLRDDQMTIDKAKEIMRGKLAPQQSVVEVELALPAVTFSETPPPLAEGSGLTAKPLSEEEFQKIAYAFVLHVLDEHKSQDPNKTFTGPRTMQLLHKIVPNISEVEVLRIREFAKLHTSHIYWYNEDEENDIPF